MYKKIFSLIVCGALALGVLGGSASAVQMDQGKSAIIMPRYTYLNSISPGLSISGGKASISGSLSGLSSVTKIEYTVSLQAKSGSSWSNLQSWSGSASGTRTTYSYTSGSVSSGKTHRTKTVATVYAGSSSEIVTAYSMEKVG